MREILDCLLHAFYETSQVFVVVFLLYVIISFIEGKIASKLSKQSKFSILLGSSIGLIPQCGVSVIGADLYIKKHITFGTIIAIFIACSDEAIPIILSSDEKAIYVLPLLLSKVIIGLTVGFLIDFICKGSKEKVHNHMEECEHEHEVKIGCCHHEINNLKDNKIKKHLIHPLIHSLKLLIDIFLINFIIKSDSSIFFINYLNVL